MNPLPLTKAAYADGVRCERLMWKRARAELPELVPDEGARFRFEQGRVVGERARAEFPGGWLIREPTANLAAKLAATRRAIADGAPVLFEAAFAAAGLVAVADVLERTATGWRLIEVKNATWTHDRRRTPEAAHLADVAFQVMVLRRAGLVVTDAELMLLRADHERAGDPLFVRIPIADELAPLTEAIEAAIPRLLAHLNGPEPPFVRGVRCLTPGGRCPLLQHCWGPLPDDHVAWLLRDLRGAWALLERGVERLSTLPDDAVTAPQHQVQRAALRAGTLVGAEDLAALLAPIEPPVTYLDFETLPLAIPPWPGGRPNEQTPVQYSALIEEASGPLRTAGYVPDGPGDPRRAVAESLVAAIPRVGPVVVYHAALERGALRTLARCAPDLAPALEAIAERIVDLEPIVYRGAHHPAFRGSVSLKVVLPALVPGVGYADLAIQNGDQAVAALRRVVLDPDTPAADRRALTGALRAYCDRDVRAMREVVVRLRALAGGR